MISNLAEENEFPVLVDFDTASWREDDFVARHLECGCREKVDTQGRDVLDVFDLEGGLCSFDEQMKDDGTDSNYWDWTTIRKPCMILNGTVVAFQV